MADPIGRGRFAPILAATVLTVLGLWLFGTVAHVFLLLFIGILGSLYLTALTEWIERAVRLPWQVAYGSALLVTVAGLAGLFWLLVPPVVEQTEQLIRVLPTYITEWEAAIERAIMRLGPMREIWRPGEHRIFLAVYEQVAAQMEGLIPRVIGIVHVLIGLFSVVVMAIYLSLHPALYREWLIALFPPVHRDLVRDVLRDLGTTLRAWIVGQLFTMFVLAVMTAIGLYALGVPYWLTFGIFTGIVAIVPFFGTLVSTLLPALFVLGTPGGGTLALLVIMLGVVIHLIESNIVAPMVMQRKVDLPPVLTIFAVLVMGTLLGPMGLLVAVPTLAAAMVLVRRILVTRIYEGHGFRRSARDRALVLRLPAPEGGLLAPVGPPADLLSLRESAR